MGYKMKGSSLYGNIKYKQTGVAVPSPFKQTGYKRGSKTYDQRWGEMSIKEKAEFDNDPKKFKKHVDDYWKKVDAKKTKSSSNKTEKSNNETSIKDGSKYSLDPNLSLNPRMRRPKLHLSKPKYVPFMIDGKQNPDWYLGVNEVHDNWDTKYKIKDHNKANTENIIEDSSEGKYVSTKGGTDTDYYSETKRKKKITDLEKKGKEKFDKVEKMKKEAKDKKAVGKVASWVKRGLVKSSGKRKMKRAERKRKKAEGIDREQELKRAQHEGRVLAAREGKKWASENSDSSDDGTYTGKLTDKDRLNNINVSSQLLRS
jgi:hypothetical protein